MAASTRAERPGDERLLVVVLADLFEGVSAMLPLAGAPTEKWVMSCLGDQKKWFGVTFSFRQQRKVDIVLGDVRAPEELASVVHRQPCVVLICPPSGDLFELGTSARVDLEQSLLALRPKAVVGLGNRALENGLETMQYFQEGPKTELRCREGGLRSGATDIRSLLGLGFQLWASVSRSPPRAAGSGGR
jgi:hypothetical protein